MSNKTASIIIPKLREIFAEQRPCERPACEFQHGDKGWSLTPDESALFNEAVQALVAEFPKIHKTTCERELQKFCCKYIPVHKAVFEKHIPTLLETLSTLEKINNTVYVQISGIKLEVQEFQVGNIRIIPSAHSDVNAHRLQIQSINGDYPNPIADDVLLACGTVTGDPAFAQSIVIEEVQITLDCLEVLSIQENPSAFLGNLGFVLLCSEPLPVLQCRSWIYSDDSPTWTASINAAPYVSSSSPGLNLRITEQLGLVLNERGLQFLNQLLLEPSRSAFDEGVLAAFRWIANAIRERDYTRKYLAFYIALEALFTRDVVEKRTSKGFLPPSIEVHDGVAFLIGQDVGTRIAISKRVRNLARTRNMIVHRGYSSVEKGDLLTLAHYSWNCAINGLKMRDQFRNEGSFAEWCQRKKYS